MYEQDQAATGKPSTPNLSNIKCDKCGRMGHYANKCPGLPPSSSAPFTSTPKINTMDGAASSPTQATDSKDKEKEDNDTDAAYNNVYNSHKHIYTLRDPEDTLVFIPIILHGLHCQAMVDTGANVSSIDSDLCERLSITTEPVSRSASIPGHGNTIFHKMMAFPIDIRAREHSTTHSFAAFQQQEGVQVILGHDLLPKLGISLCGLPLCYPDSKQEANTDNNILKRQQVMELPFDTMTREKVLQGIERALSLNESLPHGPHCNIPQAVLHLPKASWSWGTACPPGTHLRCRVAPACEPDDERC